MPASAPLKLISISYLPISKKYSSLSNLQKRFTRFKKLALLISLLGFTFNSQIALANNVTKANCAKVEERIDKINSKMKLGYSASQGERYKRQLRDLKNYKYACKKKRYPTRKR